MERISAKQPNQAEVTLWVKNCHAEVVKHPAWMGNISESKANWHLEKQSPFTYLLRSGEKEWDYYISFVKEDGLVKHQGFKIVLEDKVWYFRNGVVATPKGWTNELTAERLEDLIPMMMHCEKDECTLLTASQAIDVKA